MPAARRERRGRAARHVRAAALDRAPGRLPVQPGDGRGLPGQQPPPAARDARAPGRGRPADERPADRAEHARDRRRRRPPGMRNWDNPRPRRANWPSCGTSTPSTIPHWAPPTHAMQIWRYAEQGSIELLWISATNPAVSLPDLAPHPARSSRATELFVVVQDLFLTETARARRRRAARRDVGREDRHVHERRSHRPPLRDSAVEPPGEARSDLDIFLDYARRMDFRDRDGAPLITWEDAESAFEAWKACSRGPAVRLHRPHLRRSCATAAASNGRAPTRHRTGPSASTPTACSTPTPTTPRRTDTISSTGAADTEAEYRAQATRRAAPSCTAPTYAPSPEAPSDEHPLAADDRAHDLPLPHPHEDRPRPELKAAAPDVWVELNPDDARRSASRRATLVRIESARGAIEAPARLTRHPPRRRVRAVPLRLLGRGPGTGATGRRRRDVRPTS